MPCGTCCGCCLARRWTRASNHATAADGSALSYSGGELPQGSACCLLPAACCPGRSPSGQCSGGSAGRRRSHGAACSAINMQTAPRLTLPSLLCPAPPPAGCINTHLYSPLPVGLGRAPATASPAVALPVRTWSVPAGAPGHSAAGTEKCCCCWETAWGTTGAVPLGAVAEAGPVVSGRLDAAQPAEKRTAAVVVPGGLARSHCIAI